MCHVKLIAVKIYIYTLAKLVFLLDIFLFIYLKHSAAAQILQDVGAIEFLSQLRSDVPKSLQPVIDQILENTMRLPEVSDETLSPTCTYQRKGFSAGL